MSTGIEPPADHIIQTLLREAMADPKRRAAILEATDWSTNMVSQVTSRKAGIMLDKFDAVCGALGLALVPVEYMDYLARGNVIGSNCYCARKSMGQCGPRG